MIMPFYDGKVCLVTGGTGFIGSHIVDALLARRAQVRIPIHRNKPHCIDPSLGLTLAMDLTRLDDCRAVTEGVDIIVHAAGGVGAAGVGAAGTMDGITLNLTLTANMLQAAWENGVERILVFSSSTAYPPADHPLKESELWRGEPYSGYFGYGWMRRYLERLAEFVAGNSQVKIALVRPTAVYGPRDNFDPATCHVVSALIRRAVERAAPFEVWGNGAEVRDFLHVRDYADGCLLALEKKADCDPVNIGSGEATTIRQLVSAILRAAGYAEAEIVFNPDRPTAIPIRRVDIELAKSQLGFLPRISLEEGIADTVRWFTETGGSSPMAGQRLKD